MNYSTLKRAITVRRPWSYAITYLGKDIENRKYRLKCVEVGDLIAIHAGSKFSQEGANFITNLTGQVVEKRDCPPGIVAVATFIGNCEESTSHWKMTGHVGWRLSDIIPLKEPVSATGYLWPWELSENMKSEILAQMEA